MPQVDWAWGIAAIFLVWILCKMVYIDLRHGEDSRRREMHKKHKGK